MHHHDQILLGGLLLFGAMVVLKRSPIPTPAWALPFMSLGMGLAHGLVQALARGETPGQAAHTVLVGLASGAIPIGVYESTKTRDGSPLSKPPPLPLLLVALAFVGCTPTTAPIARTVVQIADVACVELVQTRAPGFEGLCALADDAISEIIDLETRSTVGRMSAPAPSKLLRAATIVRDHRKASK